MIGKLFRKLKSKADENIGATILIVALFTFFVGLGLVTIFFPDDQREREQKIAALDREVAVKRALVQERERRIVDLEDQVREQAATILALKVKESEVQNAITKTKTKLVGETKKILIPASECDRLRDLAARLRVLGLRPNASIPCER